MKNVKNVMDVAQEQVSGGQKSEESGKSMKGKLGVWLFGVGLAMVPLIVIPSMKLVGGEGIGEMFRALFCDISVMFVGVSFTITALNDFLDDFIGKKKMGWLATNMFLLFLGTMLYTLVVVMKDRNDSIDWNVVFWINLIYFLVMFLLALSRYIKRIVEVR